MTTPVDASPESSAQESPGAAEETALCVKFGVSGRAVDCHPNQTILEAAAAAGMPLPFACGQGMCGTCRLKLVSGQVDMQHLGGINQSQIDRGFILTCCSRPLTDITLER